MENIVKINDYLSYLKSSDNPLSSNVFFIEGKEYKYIFDVGSNEIAKNLISNIENKKIIISHFHKDHMYNLEFLSLDKNNLYIGSYTKKVLGYGNLVEEILEINDGVNLKIVPIKNTHAKGSLALIINDLYLLIGDALDGNSNGFNVSLLNEEINLLKKLDYEFVIDSHSNSIKNKEEVIKNLEYYYSKREKNTPYISYDLL